MLLRDVDSIHVHPILEPTLFLRDLDIIAAHLPLPHSTILREGPVFEPVASLPLHPIVLVLVLVPKLHCNPVVCKSEKLLAQTIRLLFLPLGGQEIDDGLGAGQEKISVTPDGVIGVCFGNDGGIPQDFLLEGRAAVSGASTHWVFQVSCAFFTLALADFSSKGGTSDMMGDGRACVDVYRIGRLLVRGSNRSSCNDPFEV